MTRTSKCRRRGWRILQEEGIGQHLKPLVICFSLAEIIGKSRLEKNYKS